VKSGAEDTVTLAVAESKLAELVGKLLSKGKKVYVDGRLTTRKYTDKTNVERYITEIVMDDFILMSEGKREGAPEQHAPSQTPTEHAPAVESNAPAYDYSTNTSQAINPDDIPF
jgi:single-strand DNA-binding protein